MSGGSRAKGNRAERHVAARLQAWWSQLEPCTFVRTPSSGGWANPQVRARFRTAGDVMTDAALFPFCVEAKRREAWSWDNFINAKASPVWGWWRQAIRQARERNEVPMLWIRQNRQPWWVLVPEVLLVDVYAKSSPGENAAFWWFVTVGIFGWTREAMKGAIRGWGSQHHPVVVLADDLLRLDPRLFTSVTRRARAC